MLSASVTTSALSPIPAMSSVRTGIGHLIPAVPQCLAQVPACTGASSVL